jgi:site-specific DNA recombinase
MRTADLYLRLSLDHEGATSIARQEDECHRWCDAHDLEVRKVHIDRGVSGFMPRAHREGFDAALAAVTAGEVGVLVVWKLDRLSRRGIGQVGQVLDDLERAGGRLVSVKDAVDTAQPQGRVVIALLSEFARAERETMGVRIRSAKEAHRAAGKWLCGKPPFGYRIGPDRRLELDEPAASVMRSVVGDVMAGKSLRAVCRDLNDRGVRTSRGNLWRISTLSCALGSPALAGLTPARHVNPDGTRASGHPVAYRDQDTGEEVSCLAAGTSPIISRALQVQLLTLNQTRLAHYGSQGQRYPIRQPATSLAAGGLARCAGCGRALVTFGHSYRCRKTDTDPRADCPRPTSVVVGTLDGEISRAWLHRLTDPVNGARLRAEVARLWLQQPSASKSTPWSTTARELADAHASLLDADTAHYVRLDLDAERHRKVTDLLKARIRELLRRQAVLSEPTLDATQLLDNDWAFTKWKRSSAPEHRQLLRLAIAAVHVSKAERRGANFNPTERLTYSWR